MMNNKKEKNNNDTRNPVMQHVYYAPIVLILPERYRYRDYGTLPVR